MPLLTTRNARHTRLRERGIKPQVFLYHPGHLDILDYLIQRDALDKPYFLQLVFGQQSGIKHQYGQLSLHGAQPSGGFPLPDMRAGPGRDSGKRDGDAAWRPCPYGLEDCIHYQRGELAQSNAQMVERIARIANDLGRGVATIEETRRMLGIDS